MEIGNNQRVGKALELLREGLAPYVEGRVPSEKIEAALQKPLGLSKNRKLKGKPVGQWDISSLLKLMMHTWKEVFHETLGPKRRALVSELLNLRNDWAHPEETFIDKDTDRALDSAERMLRAISATEQADEIDEMRQELGLWTEIEQLCREQSGEEISIDPEISDSTLNNPRSDEMTESFTHQDHKDSGDDESENTPDCPKCGSNMVRRKTKQGNFTDHYFWGCSTYPICTIKSAIEPELEGKYWPDCPKCGSKMVAKKRHSTGDLFWGCWRYFEPKPEKCDGTRLID